MIKRTWNINGVDTTVEISPGRRLIDVLRNDLNLTGTKEGCGEGECGACTILLDEKPVVSCLIPAGQVMDNATIMTIEGLEKTELGRRLQAAYLEHGAAQCGFCIPGMLISSYALLLRNPNPTEPEIREAHAGNICRCTGYKKIIQAISSLSIT